VRVNVSAVDAIPNPRLWLTQQALTRPDAAAGVGGGPGAGPGGSSGAAGVPRGAPPEGPGHAILGRVQRVGDKAHGLVPWQGAYIMLDSDNGALIALDLTGAGAGAGFRVLRLWKAPEAGM
jgi:hypothetical protein